MSTDITLELPSDPVLADFASYSRTNLDSVARAAAVAIADDELATHAITAAFRQARERWDTTSPDGLDRFVFGAAINHVVEQRANADVQDAEPLTPLLGPACAVAYFGLEWPTGDISSTLQLSPDAVDNHLEHARSNGITRGEKGPLLGDVRYHVRALLADHDNALPDLRRIERRHRWRARGKTVKITAAATVVALVGLVLLAQLVSRPERITAEAPAPTPTAEPTAAPAEARSAAGEIGNEPRPDLVPRPELIATDGEGGFVGVRSPSPQDRQVVFTRSTDGQTWSLASRWGLGPDSQITRFERSGEYYMAWIEGVATTSDRVIGTVGISRDLLAWTVVELSVDDQAPRGLIYRADVTDLSVSGNNILALVTTNVEIDFGALSLSEGYTCGQTITDDSVVVKLCNDGEIDVLSLSNVETLPERNRMFISRDGQPFARTEIPFNNRTAAHLTSVNGAFAVTDETGMRFATSRDAVTWQTITAGKPPFPVRAAATNLSNEVVGIGDLADGNIVLFHNDGQAANTTSSILEDLVGPLDADVRAVVAAGPQQWVVYLYEPRSRAWLLTSTSGADWKVQPTSPPAGESPLLLVGDDEALVQWVNDNGVTITIGVPLR